MVQRTRAACYLKHCALSSPGPSWQTVASGGRHSVARGGPLPVTVAPAGAADRWAGASRPSPPRLDHRGSRTRPAPAAALAGPAKQARARTAASHSGLGPFGATHASCVSFPAAVRQGEQLEGEGECPWYHIRGPRRRAPVPGRNLLRSTVTLCIIKP